MQDHLLVRATHRRCLSVLAHGLRKPPHPCSCLLDCACRVLCCLGLHGASCLQLAHALPCSLQISIQFGELLHPAFRAGGEEFTVTKVVGGKDRIGEECLKALKSCSNSTSSAARPLGLD